MWFELSLAKLGDPGCLQLSLLRTPTSSPPQPTSWGELRQGQEPHGKQLPRLAKWERGKYTLLSGPVC